MTTHLVLGPPAHGVTRHGEALAGEDRIVLRHVGDDASSLESLLHQASTPIHLHLTDHLLGDDAAAIERGAETSSPTRPSTCTSPCTTSRSRTRARRGMRAAATCTGGSWRWPPRFRCAASTNVACSPT